MIIGIDLGTTNSLAAVFRDGQVELIPNALGHYLTPSVVSAQEDGSLLVGLPALQRISTHPRQTVSAFKRWMGTDQAVSLGGRSMRPEELSALVLKGLKADAEAFLGQPVSEAVITVPAYFNDQQRRATRVAGELAGLKVERLLNEPTAAGLAYGLQDRPDHTRFLVFDLGGGTFDVSVLEYFEGVVEVRASAGDTRLGGEDFVRVLAEWFASQALPADLQGVALERDGRSLWRMAEQAKRDLSEHDSAELSFAHEGQTYRMAASRAEFETRCAELLQRLRRPIERALRDARLDATQLDEVVLVGGASRMPMIRQLATRLFGRLPLRNINPDESIARGAGIQAALKARDAALNEVVLTDVMPYSLGIVISQELGGTRVPDRFSPIIERNTPIPASRMESYGTVADQQREIELDIRQGESPKGSENLQLGKMHIDVPPRPRGEVQVQVRFSYDANGLLDVDAFVPLTGQQYNQLIRRDSTALTDEQVKQALARLQTLKVHPRDKQENAYLVERCKRLYAEHLGRNREDLARVLTEFEATLDSQDEHRIREQRKNFKATLDAIDTGFVL